MSQNAAIERHLFRGFSRSPRQPLSLPAEGLLDVFGVELSGFHFVVLVFLVIFAAHSISCLRRSAERLSLKLFVSLMSGFSYYREGLVKIFFCSTGGFSNVRWGCFHFGHHVTSGTSSAFSKRLFPTCGYGKWSFTAYPR
jgi:hypothetical protein